VLSRGLGDDGFDDPSQASELVVITGQGNPQSDTPQLVN
jgi:hypothetical protein